MLVKTMSCDGGMRVDLSCDTCGESYGSAAVVHYSRRLLWAAARADGWAAVGGPVERDGLARHGCPRCAVEVVAPVG